MPVTITLPYASPSLNEIIRWHWATRRKYHRQACVIMRMQVAMHKYPAATTKMHMDILRVGKRLLDMDNLIGGCKLIVDALVKERLLVNDSPQWLEGTYRQMRNGKAQWTQIIISPMETPL